MSRIQVVVLGVLRYEDNYLLLRRNEPSDEFAHHKWEEPGGGLEFGEDVEECLKREVKEETGIVVTKHKLIPKVFHKVRTNWHGVFLSFLCELESIPEVQLNDEADDYGWFTIEKAKTIQTLPFVVEILEECGRERT